MRYIKPKIMVTKEVKTIPRLSRRGIDMAFSPVARSTGITQIGGCNCNQAGGLSLKDVGKGISTAYNWARKNKPIKKLNEFVDKVVPANLKAHPIYSGIRNATGALEQAGFGTISKIDQNGAILGSYQPILAARPRRRQLGGSKRMATKTQKGTGRKRKTNKKK